MRYPKRRGKGWGGSIKGLGLAAQDGIVEMSIASQKAQAHKRDELARLLKEKYCYKTKESDGDSTEECS